MDIYVINTSSAEYISEEILKDFQKKNISDKKKWQQHCFSYLMLDRILRNVYEIENAEIEFVNNKPFLKSGEKYFSIAHSHKYIVIAFSDFDCGIDAEEMRDRDYKRIAKRMNFKSNSLYDFYRDWTLYEAQYKLSKGVNIEGQSVYIKDFDNYMISALSVNDKEQFEIYIQNGM